jgi:glycosyltransferase involved in cell wall biosynthesis
MNQRDLTKHSQDNTNLISIIIATYNAEKFLPGCLESIASQSYPNIELVVIDSCSTDNTISLLKTFDRFPVIWISEHDNGIYDALNKGIGLAKGQWLYFIGSDDRLLPGFSELASKLHGEKNIFYANSTSYYTAATKPTFEILTGKFSRYRLAKYCVNHQSVIYPSSAFKHYRYNTRYTVFADYDLNLKLWGNRHFKKIYCNVPIVNYHMDGFSSTVTDDAFKKDKPALIKSSLGWWIYLRYLLKRFKKKMGR